MRHIQVLWDTDLYSTLLPELEAAASQPELLYPMRGRLTGNPQPCRRYPFVGSTPRIPSPPSPKRQARGPDWG